LPVLLAALPLIVVAGSWGLGRRWSVVLVVGIDDGVVVFVVGAKGQRPETVVVGGGSGGSWRRL
jgi:hypothetical protein